MPTRRTLNLGCGTKYIPEAVNVDINPQAKPDILHDLNCLPWPLPNDQFLEILAYDSIEHLDDVMVAMTEIYRVACHGAIVNITVPHFSCFNSYTDPSHVRSFGYFSFDYFLANPPDSKYRAGQFKIRKQQLIFYPSVINKLVYRIANRYPLFYERRWAWIFPAWFIYVQLEVLKHSVSGSE
jgi:SAM-dependent methyltransferase